MQICHTNNLLYTHHHGPPSLPLLTNHHARRWCQHLPSVHMHPAISADELIYDLVHNCHLLPYLLWACPQTCYVHYEASNRTWVGCSQQAWQQGLQCPLPFFPFIHFHFSLQSSNYINSEPASHNEGLNEELGQVMLKTRTRTMDGRWQMMWWEWGWQWQRRHGDQQWWEGQWQWQWWWWWRQLGQQPQWWRQGRGRQGRWRWRILWCIMTEYGRLMCCEMIQHLNESDGTMDKATNARGQCMWQHTHIQ